MSNEFEPKNENESMYSFWAEQAGHTQQQSQVESEYSSTEEMKLNQSNYNQEVTYNEMDVKAYNQNGSMNPKRPRTGLKYIGVCALLITFGISVGTGMYAIKHRSQDLNSNGLLQPEVTADVSEPQEKVQAGESTDQTIGTTSTVKNKMAESAGISTIVENVMPSIVQITSTVTSTYFGQSYDSKGSGSGIIVKKDNNEILIVTNNHVVADATSINVTFVDDQTVKAMVKGTDSSADLAVIVISVSDLKSSTLKKISVAKLGDSDTTKVGEMAVAIGNALGYGQSVTVGYVSAKEREVAVSNNSKETTTLMQTDAAINPGNSGGALLNLNGEVIGINSAKYSADAVEGMGFAIPITKAIPIINDLMNREVLKNNEKGYLGISGSDITDDEHNNYNRPYGVLVAEVAKDSAAQKAGIEKNDIITKINDIDVTSIKALAERVNSYRVGTKITLTIQRIEDGSYKEKEIAVTLKGKETLDSLESNQTQEDSQNSRGDSDQNDNGGSNNIQIPDDRSQEDGYGDRRDGAQYFPWGFSQ